MRILFLCNKSPFPPAEGGPLAMNANIEAMLKGGHEVKVIALNTNKYFVKPSDIPEGYCEKTSIEFVEIDLSIKPLKAFANLFSSKSFHVDRFISKKVELKIIEALQKDQFDIVQLEMLYMAPYVDVIRKHSSAKIVLRSHNIEHRIWQRVADTTTSFFKRLYLNHLARKLKNYEINTINLFDGIVTISSKDLEFYRQNDCKIPITAIPFGLDINGYIPSNELPKAFPSLFHIGSMNWMPNEEAIQWFIKNAWPLITKKHPPLKLYLAGRMMPEWLTNLNQPNIEVIGEVPDARAFILSQAIMVVPLFSGSGIRIKIIEGMALGKPIISTSIGAEGIACRDGEDILIANDPETFLTAVTRCIENPDYCKQLGQNARKLIEKNHSLEQVLKKFEGFYNSIL